MRSKSWLIAFVSVSALVCAALVACSDSSSGGSAAIDGSASVDGGSSTPTDAGSTGSSDSGGSGPIGAPMRDASLIMQFAGPWTNVNEDTAPKDQLCGQTEALAGAYFIQDNTARDGFQITESNTKCLIGFLVDGLTGTLYQTPDSADCQFREQVTAIRTTRHLTSATITVLPGDTEISSEMHGTISKAFDDGGVALAPCSFVAVGKFSHD